MKLFGTNGIRGIANEFLDYNTLSKTGICIASVQNGIGIDNEGS